MKPFCPLADRTAQAHNLDNIHRFPSVKESVTSTIPPSYAATMDAVVQHRVSPLSPKTSNSPTGRFAHNPYGAVVVRELLYIRDGAQGGSALPVTTLSGSCLDTSRESAASTTSTATSGISPPTMQLVVKTPIRRVYRNGRPVPVFAGEATD